MLKEMWGGAVDGAFAFTKKAAIAGAFVGGLIGAFSSLGILSSFMYSPFIAGAAFAIGGALIAGAAAVAVGAIGGAIRGAMNSSPEPEAEKPKPPERQQAIPQREQAAERGFQGPVAPSPVPGGAGAQQGKAGRGK